MSNQNAGKGGAETRRTGGAPTQPMNGSANIPNPPRAAGNRPGAATRPTSAGTRPRAVQVAPKKKGFRLRPLDVGLVLAG
ncbi:MAG: hypothetical protein ABIQ44_07330, partial [Chloroflexia bacterium]